MTPSTRQLPTVFYGAHVIETFLLEGEAVWLASVIGDALTYAHGGTRLCTLIRTEWRDDFEEGKDMHSLVGERLAAFKRAFPGASVSGFASRLMVLTLRGVRRVFLKSDQPERLDLRAFFEREVVPAALHAMFDDAEPPPAPPPPSDPPAAPEEPELGRVFVLHAVVPPPAPATREERLAGQLDLRERIFRSNALRETVRVLHALDEIDDTVRAVYEVRATEIALGEDLPDLRPSPPERWYTVTDIARATGMTPEVIGRVITLMGLRGQPGLSRQVVTTAPSDDKIVHSYVYSERARTLILEACGGRPPGRAA